MSNYITCIDDNEFNKAKNNVNNYCHFIDNTITEYYNCLNDIVKDAIIDGATHEALLTYISYINQLKGVLSQIGEKVERLCDIFLYKIDDADQYLYDKDMSGGTYRDFSDHEYHKLLEMLRSEKPKWYENVWYNITDFFIEKMIEFGGYDVKKAVNDDLDNVHGVLINYNRETKRTITAIFEEVKNLDKKFGESISSIGGDYYTSPLSSAGLFFASVRNIIIKLTEIIDPANLNFNVQAIHTALTPLFTELSEYAEETLAISVAGDNITIDEIQQFTENYQNEYFYEDFIWPINDELADLNNLDMGVIVFYQGKEMTMTMLTKQFSVPADVQKSDIYSYLILKKQLAENISKITDTSKFTIAEEENLDKAKEILKAIKSGKKGFPDYENYKEIYNGILEGAGDAFEISEIALQVFCDYSQNIELLNAVTEDIGANSLAGIALRELKQEYTHKYASSAKKVADFLSEKIIGDGIEDFENYIIEAVAGEEAGGLLSIVQMGIDVSGQLSGLSSSSNSMVEFLALHNSNEELQRAYQTSFERVKNGDLSQEATDKLKYYFELVKGNYIKEYSMLAKKAAAENDYSKKAYYEYCGRMIRNRYINSKDDLKLMKYEDYCALNY